MSDSVQPHRRQPTELPCPWDSPGKNTGVGFHFLLQCKKVKSASDVTQSCPTLSHPMDCSLPGSSIHGIFQARVLEWGAIAFSTRSIWQNANMDLQQRIQTGYGCYSQGQVVGRQVGVPCTPETNITMYVNYISIKNEMEKINH